MYLGFKDSESESSQILAKFYGALDSSDEEESEEQEN